MHTKPHDKTNKTAALTLSALGVVYGDIGTSPLYSFRESIHAASSGGMASAPMVMGILSLILWAIIIIVTLKYVVILLRADNQGEGGILSLMALVQQTAGHKKGWVLTLGIAGAALFYGDAIITPAISVLSAVEGLSLVTDSFTPYINVLALGIITLLFVFQSVGTQKVSRFFAPVMVLWFAALAWGGILHIKDNPLVLQAINPLYGIEFMATHGMAGFIALGGVFLAVTGAEALYADLGHFGKKPIRIAWIFMVMPSLVINYFGQGALVLTNPEMAESPFFKLYPEWALLPMVVLSTFATVIASQAVISGAFSLTHQAVQLGLMPRLTVRYTSASQRGQIYLPKVNWLLLAGIVLLVELFRTSSNLASAYGISVTGTMVITALLAFQVMRHRWKWSLALSVLVVSPLLFIDSLFLAANLTKILDGGFMPLIIAGILILMMKTWVRGIATLNEQVRSSQYTVASFMSEIKNLHPKRVDGTAVYLSSDSTYIPAAFLHNLKHNKVLHDHNILMSFQFATTPFVDENEKITVEQVEHDITRVVMKIGYMELPKITTALRLLRAKGIKLDMMMTTFFISRRSIVRSANFGMPVWRDNLFIAMTKFGSDATGYFHIPPSRVVEIGLQMTV